MQLPGGEEPISGGRPLPICHTLPPLASSEHGHVHTLSLLGSHQSQTPSTIQKADPEEGESRAGENRCWRLKTRDLNILGSGWNDHGFGTGQIFLNVNRLLFSPLRNSEPEVYEFPV